MSPRIIVEPFLSEDGIIPPIDYIVYCFEGIPHFIHLTLNKFSDRKVLFVDTNWNIIPIGIYKQQNDNETTMSV